AGLTDVVEGVVVGERERREPRLSGEADDLGRRVGAVRHRRVGVQVDHERASAASGRGAGPVSPAPSRESITWEAEPMGSRSWVTTRTSGARGGSYGSDTPVNSGTSPARAFAYSPLTSRDSHTSIGVSTYTSTKRSIFARTSSRTDRYGEIAAVTATTPF